MLLTPAGWTIVTLLCLVCLRKLLVSYSSYRSDLTRTRQRAHITPILKSLHWFPVCHRITFKIIVLVFKSLNGFAPSYLSDMIQTYVSARSLRSSDSNLLTDPEVRTKRLGEAAFVNLAPGLWNSLPEGLWGSKSFDFQTFRKTHILPLLSPEVF